MSDEKIKQVVTDRTKQFRPHRFRTLARIGTVSAIALAVGGGYLGLKLSAADEPHAEKVTVPKPGETTSVQQSKPALFSAYPKIDVPEPEGPSLLETKLTKVEGALEVLDGRFAALAAAKPADPNAAFEAKVASLEKSTKAVEDTLAQLRAADKEERAEERRRRDELRMEISELRARLLAQPTVFSGASSNDESAEAEAEHRRELERLRLEADLAAKERLETRKLEEQLAAIDHTRRLELTALEKSHTDAAEQAKFEHDRALIELEARLRANEISVERAAAERERIAAEQRAKEERARAKADADLAEAKAASIEFQEKERARRASGGIVIDDTGNASIGGFQSASFIGSGSSSVTSEDASRLLLEGTLISGVLETAIQSDIPGSIRAVVSDDVWSADASQVVLPKGSRLIGQYESRLAQGQSRVLIAWTRAITPDHRSIALDAAGVDSLGRAGLTGDVDQHFGTKFEAALMISVVSAIGQFGANAALPRAEFREALNTGSETVTEAGNDALGEYLSIPPTIHVDQGTPINVFVSQDVYL